MDKKTKDKIKQLQIPMSKMSLDELEKLCIHENTHPMIPVDAKSSIICHSLNKKGIIAIIDWENKETKFIEF